jgi:hypothetical protein
MDIITGTIMGILVLRNFVTIDILDEDTGKRQKMKFKKGRFSKRELHEFRNKIVEIEFETGNDLERKLLRISFYKPGNITELP